MPNENESENIINCPRESVMAARKLCITCPQFFAAHMSFHNIGNKAAVLRKYQGQKQKRDTR